MQDVDPALTGLYLGADKEVHCDIGLQQLIPSRAMGGGFYKFLSLAVTLLTNKGHVIFIDEIENGLHPLTQEQLWRVIMDWGESLELQVFATTHSYDCLRSFKKAQEEHEGTSRVFRVEKRTDGARGIVAYSPAELDVALQNFLEIR